MCRNPFWSSHLDTNQQDVTPFRYANLKLCLLLNANVRIIVEKNNLCRGIF